MCLCVRVCIAACMTVCAAAATMKWQETNQVTRPEVLPARPAFMKRGRPKAKALACDAVRRAYGAGHISEYDRPADDLNIDHGAWVGPTACVRRGRSQDKRCRCRSCAVSALHSCLRLHGCLTQHHNSLCPQGVGKNTVLPSPLQSLRFAGPRRIPRRPKDTPSSGCACKGSAAALRPTPKHFLSQAQRDEQL